MVLAIGIDLGTANTRVAVYRNDQFEIIPHEGRSSFPSVVAFTDRVRLIGEAAKIHGNLQPQNAIYGALSFLGVGPFGDSMMDTLIKDAPFNVTDSLDTLTGKRRIYLRVFDKGAWTAYDPLEILAMVIVKAKKDAESYLGYTVSEAVITVPAMFNYAQRYAIRDAAAVAGIKPLLLIHPPAAGLMDLLITRRKATEEHVVLICDVGARYINITCAMLECGVIDTKAVTWGVEAGDAFTRRLVRHMINIFAKQWPNDDDAKKLDSRAMHRLRRACEHAKHQLSSMQETVVEIEALHKGRDLKVSITRTRFEELIQDLVHAIIDPFEKVLRDARIDKKDVHDVILIGGSSRIPKIQQVVSAFFDGKELLRCLNVEETAVRGAAVEAAVFSGDTSSKSTEEVLLLDVLTRDLGIGTAAGVMKPLMRRTYTIPTKKNTELLEASVADKSGLAVTIFEGDRVRTKDCLQLGRTYVPIPADSGDSKGVLVDFNVDRHSILTVEVTDRNTGKSETFKIDGHNKESFDRLSVVDLERLREAELRMQIEDDIEQRRVEARNTLEELLYSIKAWSAGFEEHERADDVSRLCVVVDAVLGWLDTDVISSASEFESRTKELQKRYEDAVENQARWTEWKHAAENEARWTEYIRQKETRRADRERTAYDRLPRQEAQKGYRERRTTQDLEDQKKPQRPKTRTETIQAAVDRLTPVLDSIGLDRDQDVASDDPYAPQPLRAKQYPVPMPYSPAPPVEYSLYQKTGQGSGIETATKVAESRPEASDLNQPSSSTVIADSNDQGENQKSPDEIEETRTFLSPTHERLATMTPDSIERSATPRTAQRGLASLFTISPDSSHTYTDTEFIQISTYLKNTGQPDWSLVPRLYTVLRLIGGLDLLGVFIEQGITDIWFPFGPTTLPRVLTPSVKANFLKYQEVVLSKSLLFEKSPERKHVAFQKGEPLPYEVVGKLGAGAHGQVDKVLSTVSHREYARKLFQRMRGMRKDAIKSFLTELQVLKRIQHYHCVELVQSYTDPKFFALIMSPVGDCNLLEYYSVALNDPDKTSLLRSFLGCLANALQYLHGAKIRHRDIKPHNILVKGDRVFLTDFGIALDWEELSRSTTTADSGKTWLYAAPEVVRYEKRNTSADIWSLGCVFMEISTILKGQAIAAMREFFEQQSGNYRFYANTTQLVPWIDFCRKSSPGKDDVVFDWALLMLEEDPEKRPTAASLHHDISAECTRQGLAFCGTCCLEVGESSSVEEGSDDDAWDFDADERTVTADRVGEHVT